MGFDVTNGRIIVFGGRDASRTILADTWVYTLSSGQWQELTGAGPEARFSVVSGVDQTRGNRFLVSTGEGLVDGVRTFYNDVWSLDLASLQWTKLATTGTPPEPRYGSAGGTFPGNSDFLVVTHGFAKTRYQNTLALDLQTLEWKDRTPAAGDIPFNRCLHAGVALPLGEAALAGGCGSGGWGPCPANDAWVIKSSTVASNAEWSKSASPCAGPRLYMSMAHMPGSSSSLLMFGGSGWIWGSGEAGVVALWNTLTDSWTRFVPQSGSDGLPSVRQGSGFARGTENGTEAVYLVGGLDSSGALMDIWKLSGTSATGLSSLDCPGWWDLRILHGVLMFLAWGFCLPLGITIARFGRVNKWFPWHRGLQITGVILSTAGLVVAILMVGAGKFAAVPHSFIGLLVALIGLQQPLNAFFRPEPPHVKSAKRVCWERWHKYCGRIGGFLGILNPFWGLYYLDKTGPFFVVYSIWVAGLVTFWVAGTLMGRPASENPSQIAKAVGICPRAPWSIRAQRFWCGIPEEKLSAKA